MPAVPASPRQTCPSGLLVWSPVRSLCSRISQRRITGIAKNDRKNTAWPDGTCGADGLDADGHQGEDHHRADLEGDAAQRILWNSSEGLRAGRRGAGPDNAANVVASQARYALTFAASAASASRSSSAASATRAWRSAFCLRHKDHPVTGDQRGGHRRDRVEIRALTPAVRRSPEMALGLRPSQRRVERRLDGSEDLVDLALGDDHRRAERERVGDRPADHARARSAPAPAAARPCPGWRSPCGDLSGASSIAPDQPERRAPRRPADGSASLSRCACKRGADAPDVGDDVVALVDLERLRAPTAQPTGWPP